MDGYAAANQTLYGMYMIQGGEVTPGYFIEQSFYSPGPSGYGHVSAGVEPVSDFEDDQEGLGLDGDDIHYPGVTHENPSYLYYVPSYVYTESPYNPYNPYIPGAVLVEEDGSTSASYHYTVLPSCTDCASLPAQMPVVILSGAEVTSNGTGTSFTTNIPSAECNFYKVGKSANTRSRLHHPLQTPSGRFKHTASAKASLAQRAQAQKNGTGSDTLSSDGSQINSCLTFSNDSNLSTQGCTSIDEPEPELPKDVTVSPPHTWNGLRWTSGPKKPKNELVVKAYTTRAGNSDPQGNIRIFRDQYNRNDFCVDYVNAKFFVIKSYSEDDVHKGVKYNVWSSTPAGNKKLNAAYEDAQRLDPEDAKGCPVFLFFSVNASGQFCGVARMIGPVNFKADMDFWQQDKWSGSFPVEWHFIKDVPNSMLRHITLEKNENKPVTNSRDTQEIPRKKGLDMLRIFKNHISKTSLLDDFMYYETRQLILLQERAKQKGNATDVANLCRSTSSGSLEDHSVPEKHYSEEDTAKRGSHASAGTTPPKSLVVPERGAPALIPKTPEPAYELPTASVSSTKSCASITIGSLPVSISGPKGATVPLQPCRNR